MGIDTAAILGLIQGVTEFIPVSSSGHLIVGREVINLSASNGLAFDAVLQLATAFAILAYFWSDLVAFVRGGRARIGGTNLTLSTRLIGVILLATIPAVIAGLWLEPLLDTVFRRPEIVAGSLIIGSVLILLAEHLSKKSKEKVVSLESGLLVGCYQVLALVPGMSRSGATISGGLLAGFSRQTATSFAFLLGLPILFGAGGKKLLDLVSSGALETLGWPLLVGSITAFVSGLLAMHVLMRFVKNHRLDWFAGYRILLAVAVLVFLT